MNQKLFLMLFLGFIIMGCSSDDKDSESSNSGYQTISALGDTLYAASLEINNKNELEAKLDTALTEYKENPGNAEAIIWYGRRTAYLGNYQEAIGIFSEGIEKHPKDARLYRHRGHRYITTRQFDKAIKDLTGATELIYGKKDTVELDGLPNEQNKPRSTLQTNIWYHLGLAYYLKGEFEEARNAFEECLRLSKNDDMKIATSYWLYMTLRRHGLDGLAGDILEPISENMDIIENQSYHRLLLVFKGLFNANMIQKKIDDNADNLSNATLGYGLGNWHYINGRENRAEEFFRNVYEGQQWNAFGYIAAERDLARLFGN